MGFYYPKIQKKAQKQKIRDKNAPPPIGRKTVENVEMLNRLGCKICPLNNTNLQTPKMEPELAKETIVYVLAEAPGRDEDERTGKPLTGKSGKLLRNQLPDEWEDYITFDNVVNCRPQDKDGGNREPVWTEIECCRPRRIKWIEETKPKLILGFGRIPLIWALGSTDIAGMRGRFFAIKVGNHKCWFTATYHPSYILRKAEGSRDPLRTKFGSCFKTDIDKAFEAVNELRKPRVDSYEDAVKNIETFSGDKGFDVLMRHFDDALESPKSAIDYETNYLRPFKKDSKVLSAAISYKKNKEQKTFAFALHHVKAKWSESQKKKIKNRLKEYLLNKKTKIAHNVPFELEWSILEFDPDVVKHDMWEDTMMQAQFIDERRGSQGSSDSDQRAVYQGLGFLTKKFYGIDIKKIFKFNKFKMESEDLDQVLVYNGVDAKYTFNLHTDQKHELKRIGTYKAFLVAKPRQATVALMQHLGMDVDQDEVKKHQKKLNTEIENLESQIKDLKVVKKFISDNKEFNPLSNPEVLSIFKDYLKRPEVRVENERHVIHQNNIASKFKKQMDSKMDEGEKYRYTVDKNVLSKIDHPLAKLIMTYRSTTKLKSTYVDCLEFGVGNAMHDDGKIHTTFNTTFAETGRLSSDSPNMQNYDKRNNPWVRSTVVAPKNNIIIAVDYGQLEWCTTAICTRDKVIVKSIWDNYDIHMDWAIKIANIYPEIIGGKKFRKDKDVMKAFRGLVKNKMVFPVIFGAANESVADYLQMPQDLTDEIMDDFFKVFHGLKGWQKRLMKDYYETGFVESPTGRRRNYPLSMNQVINHPIQSVACDIVCDSMIELSRMAQETNMWHLHPRLNIHDDLTFVVPDNDQILEESIETIYRTMITPRFDFINVPLSVDVSIGKNWFELKSIGKFYANKDL